MFYARLKVTDNNNKVLYFSEINCEENDIYIERDVYFSKDDEPDKRPALLDEDKLNIIKIANRNPNNKLDFENWEELGTGDYSISIYTQNTIPEDNYDKVSTCLLSGEFTDYKCKTWDEPLTKEYKIQKS